MIEIGCFFKLYVCDLSDLSAMDDQPENVDNVQAVMPLVVGDGPGVVALGVDLGGAEPNQQLLLQQKQNQHQQQLLIQWQQLL